MGGNRNDSLGPFASDRFKAPDDFAMPILSMVQRETRMVAMNLSAKLTRQLANFLGKLLGAGNCVHHPQDSLVFKQALAGDANRFILVFQPAEPIPRRVSNLTQIIWLFVINSQFALPAHIN